REVSAIAAGKCSRSHAANGNSLPIAIVNISGNPCDSRILQGKSERALPCSLWDCIACPCRWAAERQSIHARVRINDRPKLSPECEYELRVAAMKRLLPPKGGTLARSIY